MNYNLIIYDIVENEADLVHFDTIHGIDSLVPKYLQGLIDIKNSRPLYRVCRPPNTFCADTQLKMSARIGFINFPNVIADIRQIGPATAITHTYFESTGTTPKLTSQI